MLNNSDPLIFGSSMEYMGNCGSEHIIKNNLSLMTAVKSLLLYYSKTKK